MGAFDPKRLRPLAVKYGRRYEAGAVIFLEADEGADFFVVLDGEVEISKTYPAGGGGDGDATEVLGVLGPGDFFGEMALLEEARRFAAARARTDVECLVFGRKDFEGILAGNARLSMQMLRSLSRRLREACAQPRRAPPPPGGRRGGRPPAVRKEREKAPPATAVERLEKLLETKCPACRADASSTDRFCAQCGTRL